MVKVTGTTAVKARIRRGVGPEAVREIGKALFVGASIIATSAQQSITTGAVSGKGHVPSKPGEPPNADTHALDRQIEAELVGPLKAQAASNDPKSKHLEYGTSRMEARPFMAPAGQREKEKVTALVIGAVNRVNAKSGI